MNEDVTFYEIVVSCTYSYHFLSPGTKGTGPEHTTTQVFFCEKAAGQK